jgi:FixJ family two-component response regulator
MIDINLGPNSPSGIDAFQCLKEIGFHGHIIFFTGHAQRSPFVTSAQALGAVEILEKPIAVEKLREALDRHS